MDQRRLKEKENRLNKPSADLLRVLRGGVSPIAVRTLSHILSRPFFSIYVIRLRRICMNQRFPGLVPENFRCFSARRTKVVPAFPLSRSVTRD